MGERPAGDSAIHRPKADVKKKKPELTEEEMVLLGLKPAPAPKQDFPADHPLMVAAEWLDRQLKTENPTLPVKTTMYASERAEGVKVSRPVGIAYEVLKLFSLTTSADKLKKQHTRKNTNA